jgi:hypothetical protein
MRGVGRHHVRVQTINNMLLNIRLFAAFKTLVASRSEDFQGLV